MRTQMTEQQSSNSNTQQVQNLKLAEPLEQIDYQPRSTQLTVSDRQNLNNRLNKIITHGPSPQQGAFMEKAPPLNYEVKARIQQLRNFHNYQCVDEFRLEGSRIIERGQEEHGFFCFKKTGIVYLGQWKDGKPKGWGRNYYPNGGYYEGSFVDGIPHGNGRFIMENGDFYEGQVRFGRANGNGYYETETGQYRGCFRDNLRHGFGQQRTEEFLFQGIFEYGQRKEGTLKYESNQQREEFFYEGEFENNQYDGKGTLSTQEGIYVGQFRKGLQNGYGEFKWSDGSVYRGYYHRGNREGDGEFYNGKNKSISRGFWKKGVLDGQGEYIEPDGKMFKCKWVKGKIEDLRHD